MDGLARGLAAAALTSLIAGPAASQPAGPARRSTSDPLAEWLCGALQDLPATRRAACCGAGAASLAGLCARELSASVARGAITLDATRVDQCAADTAHQLEGCNWVTPLLPKPPTSCATTVQGRVKAGEACRSSLECADDLFCRGVAPGKTGACAKPAAPRTRCETAADNLVSYTRSDGQARHRSCDGVCVKGQCVAFAPAGGACASSAACATGLQCIEGRCQDRSLPGVGAACGGQTSCTAGASCVAGVCVALRDAGEACTLPSQCRAFACILGPGSGTGTCGEPCGAGGKRAAPASSP